MKILFVILSGFFLSGFSHAESLKGADKVITCTTTGDFKSSFVVEWRSNFGEALQYNGRLYRDGDPIADSTIGVVINDTRIMFDNTTGADKANVRKLWFTIDRVTGSGLWIDGPSKYPIQCKPGKETKF